MAPALAATAADHAALVRSALQGDEDSFAALVQEFAPRLLRFLAAGGLGHADAEDVVQETFIRAHRHLARYDARYALSTWLYTIALRLAANRRRDASGHAPLGDHDPAAPAERERDPLADTVWAVARRHLPARDFQALWLRYAEDQDFDAIGAVIGTNAATARVVVHRARERLAPHLQEHRP
jgi:RNA polymerase sigma-70 factor (ECF subfamily)